jgi:hypothetical protein
MEVSFDIISDLYLNPEDNFNWEGKSTSLYCIVAGNVSSDLRTLFITISHLSKFYQGIFYIPGVLEYTGAVSFEDRTKEILNIFKPLNNIAILYHHVVIIDKVAVLGANCWSLENKTNILDNTMYRLEDIAYLNRSVQKLQTHLDVKNIILVTNAVPKKELYFGEEPNQYTDHVYPELCLNKDTEFKITHWVYGTYDKSVETNINNITYINNSYYKRKPYWPKRVTV